MDHCLLEREFHLHKTRVEYSDMYQTYAPKPLETCGHFDKRRQITNVVRCHNALIQILLTSRFAATFLLFAPAIRCRPLTTAYIFVPWYKLHTSVLISHQKGGLWWLSLCIFLPSALRALGHSNRSVGQKMTREKGRLVAKTGVGWWEKAGLAGLRRRPAAGSTTLCFIAANPFQAFTTLNGPLMIQACLGWCWNGHLRYSVQYMSGRFWLWNWGSWSRSWCLDTFICLPSRLTSNSAFSVQAKKNKNLEWTFNVARFDF